MKKKNPQPGRYRYVVEVPGVERSSGRLADVLERAKEIEAMGIRARVYRVSRGKKVLIRPKAAKKNPLPLNRFIKGEIRVVKKNGRRVIQFRRSK
ncbi:MAG TPA: hypothetical protein VFA28_01955 [Bryobacteraceae bacterium]|jgi:hypothetical protein|nr:hypothetical protein [Bryobacteraceae bacterium]